MGTEEKGERIIGLAPKLIKLIVKVIKYSKGGLTKEERQELGQDLLELAADVLEEVLDED